MKAIKILFTLYFRGFKYLEEFVIGTMETNVNSTFYIEIRITRNSCDAVLDTLYEKD